VNLNNIITEHLASPEFGKIKNFHSELRVETDLDPSLLNISGSPVHLSKTVMNLVSNAAEAMPDGGTIRISTQNRYLDKPVKGYDAIEEGDYVLVQISDTGIGIGLEDRERIFEPFYTKKVMGRSGTGLGMAVVWGTVKDHRGYIDLQSVEGEGTMFTLFFPVTREILGANQTDAPVAACNGQGETILIVDDVAQQRQIASLMLKRLGYCVDSVPNGEAAVEYIKSNSADLIVLDMIMDPGIDGLETYKKIIRHKPGQKAIIASGFSETWRVKEAQRLGAGAYVKKPYTIDKIGQAVAAELGR
jgi:CheY-like chemotaxis protein